MLEIAKTDVLKSLRRDNPWWDASYKVPQSSTEKKRAYFGPFSALALDWSVRRSTILMGPRRVGKTVMLRQLIEQTTTEGFNGQNILFVSIDTPLYSGMPLSRLIELFEEETGHNPQERRIIVFDEIQYLKDWEVHLKVLTDQHPNTRFIASGSAAAALRLKSEESGAGRFTDFFLPPLTFAEFLAFRELEDDLINAAPLGATKRFSTPDIARLNEEFIHYLNFGGYPEAVLNKTIQADVQRFLGRDIIDKVLLRDLPSLYGIQDIQELNRLFTTLAYHTGQEVSLDGLAQSSGVAKNTITKYLDYLEAAFLIVRVRRVDDTGKTFQRMRNFKVYLTNPSMRSALFAQISDGDDAMGAMAETAIFSQWFHSPLRKNLHYARWKKGRSDLEVDLVRVDPARLKPTWAYEIKWSDRYATDQPGELRGLIEFAKRNFESGIPAGATTKTITAESEIDGVLIRHFPCSLHCYQVGKNVAEGRAP
ncbi:ATP-binding protein [Ruegeria sp. 2205SS24-7]|uniref:ATP-binding protein n=1 Tax=Ruegeria discodermiae TaxID=3064389 RepID=UPI0027428DBE|nr:ATP-binding protein [Ruegeria sp. 2205SS24-7]MDP5218782.1 ATP-binding protein [Ruegeria sp. 2205SS24-7]